MSREMLDTTVEASPDLAAIPTISVRFPVEGRTLPADHGYALYAAIARSFPALHNTGWLGIELVSGVPWQQGIVALPTRSAALRLRLPADRFAAVLPLAGQQLDVGGHIIRLGIPIAQPLTAAASLYARVVTIKKFTEPQAFLEAANRQLAQVGITATLELPIDEQGEPRRRVLRIKDAVIVGFSLAAHDLSGEDSIRLQAHGIGGRRVIGCGMFSPIKQLTQTADRHTEP